MPPLVTIGLTAYNRARFLPQAIESALSQTHRDLEIIIADDASRDETPNVAQGYAARDPRIRFVRQPANVGVVKNLDFLVAEARGRYFLWLSDDDIIEPEFIERAVRTMEEDPSVVLCFSDFCWIDEDGRVIRTATLDHLRADHDWNEGRIDIFSYPYWRSSVAAQGLYRLEALRKTGTIRARRGSLSGSEAPLLARLAARGRIVALPGILFRYREHTRSKQALAHTESSGLGRVDLALLYLSIGLEMLEAALTANTSARQRLRLVGAIARAGGRKLGESFGQRL